MKMVGRSLSFAHFPKTALLPNDSALPGNSDIQILDISHREELLLKFFDAIGNDKQRW
jgi:hypothetical protein